LILQSPPSEAGSFFHQAGANFAMGSLQYLSAATKSTTSRPPLKHACPKRSMSLPIPRFIRREAAGALGLSLPQTGLACLETSIRFALAPACRGFTGSDGTVQTGIANWNFFHTLEKTCQRFFTSPPTAFDSWN